MKFFWALLNWKNFLINVEKIVYVKVKGGGKWYSYITQSYFEEIKMYIR